MTNSLRQTAKTITTLEINVKAKQTAQQVSLSYKTMNNAAEKKKKVGNINGCFYDGCPVK